MLRKLVHISFSSNRCFAFVVIVSFVLGIAGCQAKENELSNSDMTIELPITDDKSANYQFASNHLRIAFDTQWRMS